MCGIAGLLKINGEIWQESPKELQTMLSTMAHRGPDSCNTLTSGPLTMGANRLSIIDPGPQSDQPISSSDGNLHIVFNGEIYNFRELREQLIRRGYHFKTASDTEVLLALYQTQGRDCLSSLRGMFAFAIWNSRDRTLFIARDRFGEKPLFYCQDSTTFSFASELPALLAAPDIKRKIDPIGVHMAMFYMHAIAPHSPFTNIRKLPPAHFLQISAEKFSIKRYWQCTFTPSEEFSDETECIEAIRECFDDTVALMSRCDTPVGALLSGGLDSSAVVASMANTVKSFPTFRISAGPTPENLQEQTSAIEVSRKYSTIHHEYLLTADDFHVLEKVILHHGEPIATAVPMDAFVLAREVKKHVKVVLCGAGADELFGGYRDHQIFHILDGHFQKWHAIEHSGSTPSLAFTSKEEHYAWEMYTKLGRTHPELIFPSLRFNNDLIFEKIYTKKMVEITKQNDPVKLCIDEYRRSGANTLFNAFISQQVNCVSQYCMAEINDRTGMAHAVEIRSPFLDVKMVELALKIPPRFKVGTSFSNNSASTKRILRKAMANRLPQATTNCEKIPYGGTTPYDKWMQNDCSAFIEQKLQSDALGDSGLYNMAGIQELFTLYQCGVALDRDLFIGLVSTAIWMENFL